MRTALECIALMTASGNTLSLPKDDQFECYAEVKKILTKAGGKYKRCAFIFPGAARIVQERLTGGEKVDDKKKFQFFPTPPELAERVRNLAGIDEDHHLILEPSAGHGALLEGLTTDVHCVELNPDCRKVLEEKGFSVIGEDFMTLDRPCQYDRIIANPPFTKNQDIDHIKKMYECLCVCGRLVSVASNSWRNGSQKKQVAFREWLNSTDSEVIDIEAGAFKTSGTNVSSCIIVINK
jgi:hypothetical protein